MVDVNTDIVSAAERAVALSKARDGQVLDYSEASLAIVEDLLAEISSYAADMTDTEVQTLVECFGCYVLEVGRRAHGGRYQWFDQREEPILVVEGPDFRIAMITWGRVRGRIEGDPGDNIPFFYDGFAQRVRAAEPATDALYV
ncbi:hypothetical protein [Nocardia africana]|uniref:DUF3806 domain-containing protein n=1 Tax=Nocardia africana TaxID=134964 RepID=A0A378X423_9NOCA|nr:hypothetical protein [Nocardia africana]MCC3316788.1 hypothetical protein [Nocardia africana]SUA47504.1 Uncharacterised protein [Nocardia africana]